MQFHARQFTSQGDTSRKTSQLAGDVVEDPVGVGPDRCIGVLKDQDETAGTFRDMVLPTIEG